VPEGAQGELYQSEIIFLEAIFILFYLLVTVLVVFFFFFFGDRSSLCSPGWFQTHNPPALSSQVLGFPELYCGRQVLTGPKSKTLLCASLKFTGTDVSVPWCTHLETQVHLHPAGCPLWPRGKKKPSSCSATGLLFLPGPPSGCLFHSGPHYSMLGRPVLGFPRNSQTPCTPLSTASAQVHKAHSAF
jgi:hypothetical protein